MAANNNRKHGARVLLCLLLIFSLLSASAQVFAEDPYRGYNYNFYGRAAAPNGYLPEATYNGTEWGIGYLNQPTDMYVQTVDGQSYLYLLDSGNGRIIKVNENFELVSVIDSFTLNGESTSIRGAKGLCVTKDGEIYICDTENHRVIVMDDTGAIKPDRIYGKPVSPMISESLVFYPKKIEVTETGDMYVIVDNVVNGALIITQEHEFNGFFATDAVTLTAESAAVVFWRQFMTKTQRQKMISIQPVPFDNMYLDGDFLYTATTYLREEDQIRKINPAGVNLFAGNNYGESYNNTSGGDYEQAAFIDVNVTDKGFFCGLDNKFCKIFMYNQDNELLTIFGGKGDADGMFSVPVAIESIGDKVIVMDQGKDNITVFAPTSYGEKIMTGSYMYEHGDYERAEEPWYEVLKHNANSELAYRGIARAEYLKGDYQAAIKHYAAAYDREGYSEARQKYRSAYLSKHFTSFVLCILAIVVVLSVLSRNRKRLLAKVGYQTLAETGYAGMKKWKYPFYNLLHPSDGMSEMRYNKKESLPLAILFAFLWYASTVIIRQYEDYIFNSTDKNNINIFMIFATTIGILLVGCLANWAITTLVDGKGTFRNIFIYASYALIPTTIATFLVTFLSHYMVQGEAVFVQVILFVGTVWTAILMFIGMMTVHMFSTKKALLMVLLTAVGMLLIVFLLMLLAVLYSQVSTFVTTIIYEIIYKFTI